jgi:hypothetical protein
VDHFIGTVTQEVSEGQLRRGGIESLDLKEPQGASAKQLEILYPEYRRIIESIDRQVDHIIRVATIGFSATGALLVLVSGAGPDIYFEEWVFWLAPLMLTLLYCWIINHLYHMSFSSYYARELEDDIARRSGIPYFHHENTVVRALSSFRGGFRPYLITTVMALLFAFAIYATLVGVSFFKLKDSLHIPLWRQTLFIIVQIVLSVSLFVAGFGISSSLRAKYNQWITRYAADTTPQPGPFADRKIVRSLVSYAILPRLFDFLYKGSITFISMIITAIVLHVPIDRELWLTGIVVVVCVDFLAKQSTYIWNDVLDVEADRIHPYKGNTRLLGQLQRDGVAADQIGIALFVVRAVASVAVALVLAFEAGLVWIVPIVAFIYIWQWIYDRRAKRWPEARAVVASMGYSERALAGSLAAMSVGGNYDLTFLILLAGWIVVFMFVVLTEYWWAERHFQWKRKFRQDYPSIGSLEVSGTPRIWFLTTAPSFERASNAILFVIGLVMAYFYAQMPSTRLGALLTEIGGRAQDLRTFVTGIIQGASEAISSIWSMDVLNSEFSWQDFIVVVGVGSVAGIVLMRALRDSVTSERRGAWLVRAVALLVLFLVIAPSDLRLITLALMAPLLVAIAFTGLSYKEITRSEIVFKKITSAIPGAIYSQLFHPRGVRISINRINSSASDGRYDWAADLQEIYSAWAHRRGLKEHPVLADGGGPFDLLLEGRIGSLRQLQGESGIHRRVVRIDTAGASFHILQNARVYVRPVSVIAVPSMGNGLETPRRSTVSCPDEDLVEGLVRRYESHIRPGTDQIDYDAFRVMTRAKKGRNPEVVDALHRARTRMNVQLFAAIHSRPRR